MRHDWISTGAVATLAIVWGSSFALVEVALTAFAPLQIALGRIWLSALVLVAVFGAMRLPMPRGAAVWAHLAALGVLSLVLPFTLLAWGQTQVPSNVAAIFISGTPLFALVLARVVLREAIGPRKWLGFAIGFAGLVVLIGPDALLSMATADAAGQFACLGAALSYSLSALVVRRMPGDLHPVAATAGSQGMAALVMLPVLVLSGPPVLSAGLPLAALAALGLVQTGAAQILRYYTVRRAGPVFVSIVGYLIPIWAGFLSLTVLGEPLTGQAVLAYALVLAGLTIARPGIRKA